MNPTRSFAALLAALLLTACADDVAAPEVYFCADPHGTCSDVVVGLVAGAGSTVECAVFSFTDDDIAQAMVDAVGRGVQVWVVYDSEQGSGATMKKTIELLGDGGVYLRRDGNSSYMHHKFAVIDGETVATGSFNFTNNANWNNDENLLVLRSAGVAGEYSAEFQRVWNEGK